MGLENFGLGGSPDKTKSTVKKKPSSKKVKKSEEDELIEENAISQPDIKSSPTNSKRKQLKCTNGKCNFQRVLYKKDLLPEDYICSKCNSQMKLLK
jgi:hypothetical protein